MSAMIVGCERSRKWLESKLKIRERVSMYYPDLSFYPSEGKAVVGGYLRLSVGWLAAKQPYTQGDVSVAFTDHLWVLCRNSVLHMLGYHKCPFCSNSAFGVLEQNGSEELRLGSAEIRVLGKNKIIYAAPDLIYHYVVEHHYRPPNEFVQAVLEGPLPESPEYKTVDIVVDIERSEL